MLKQINQNLKETYQEHYRIAISFIHIYFIGDLVIAISSTYYAWTGNTTFQPIMIISMILLALIREIDTHLHKVFQKKWDTLFYKKIEKPCDYVILPIFLISFLKMISLLFT